ncbi:MAG: hypothetical protein KAT40_01580 [Bacteroidales bacterium]|nr:hypothetical protein [Bacteroidales bacterium]
MKRSLFVFIIIALLFAFPQSGKSQCKGFAKKICKAELSPFIHDGNYHAAILTEGEEAELYKTFYSDQEYRIAICGSVGLPNIEFKIVDAHRNELYNNRIDDYTNVWDFKLDSSQQLKLVVKVLKAGDETEEPESGCVAIMFGFKVK